jgi:hypothetical protein
MISEKLKGFFSLEFPLSTLKELTCPAWASDRV